MSYGRQLRLFLADGTSSGPRFYEIVNRTIQALGVPATRIKELVSGTWNEVQKPGVYLVYGTTKDAAEMLYIGKGENVASRVQLHPEKLEFDVSRLLLFTSKDENLNASQVGWLESTLVRLARDAKRVTLANVQTPEFPSLPKAELATVQEFLEDLKLIAQTAGYDFFSSPDRPVLKAADSEGDGGSDEPARVEFHLTQPTKNLSARGFPSDEGFVVQANSAASAQANESFRGSYLALRQNLINQGVLSESADTDSQLVFTVDYAFSSPSAAASVIMGNSFSGNVAWKTQDGETLGDYLLRQTAAEAGN